jgi:DNA-binding NtrC family response regulator
VITPSILVVDDEPNSLFGICQILVDEGYRVTSAGNGREALEKIKAETVNVVVTDEKMPHLDGLGLLEEIRRLYPGIPVILITAYGSVSMAVEALKRGAYYFFEKPVFNQIEQFLAIIRQALKSQEMEKQLDHLRREVSEKYAFPNIVANHPRMLEIFEIVGRVARTDNTVLIQGESGTGKDLVAKTVHYNSFRKERALVTVNCGALTDNLLTTELFGHSKGAFTGAIHEKTGRFQMADGGTVVLDEIGEVPIHLQKTLLRVIEEKEFEKVGDSRPIKIDVRIIATTNRNLEEEIGRGNFRGDLYYRLSMVPITLPPLRERASDVPLLVNHFLRRAREGEAPIRIEPEALEQLKAYRWPGNVRELANVVQQMALFCKGDVITSNDLPPHLFSKESPAHSEKNGKVPLLKLVGDLEKKWITTKLKEADWNQEKAAELLGLTRKMLATRIEKYHIRLDKK